MFMGCCTLRNMYIALYFLWIDCSINWIELAQSSPYLWIPWYENWSVGRFVVRDMCMDYGSIYLISIGVLYCVSKHGVDWQKITLQLKNVLLQ